MLSRIEERLDQGTARGLANAVVAGIRDGSLPAGTKLPPIREVAAQLCLSPTTVSAAWHLLSRAGSINADGRRGTTIAAPGHAGAHRYRRALDHGVSFAVDLSLGTPDPRLLPDVRPAVASLQRAAASVSYLEAPVLPGLVEVIRSGWPYPPPALTLFDGAMDAVDQITRAFLPFGSRVVVEHPCFPPLLDLLDSVGIGVVGVPVDGEGLEVEALRQAMQAPVDAVVLQPRAQNPTGISTTPERLEQLAQVLAPTTALVVENDSMGDVSNSLAASVGTLLPDRVVHVRSYSKSHGPDLRLAAVSGPEDLVDTLNGRRQVGQGWSSRMLQHILHYLLTDPQTIASVETAATVYAQRRAAVVTRLRDQGVHVDGTDGLNAWIPVADETAAVLRLANSGIGVAPGAPFAVHPMTCSHIRATVGVLAESADSVTQEIADAARTAPRFGR